MEEFDLDTPLIEFRDKFGRGSIYWTLRDASQGICIFGGIGSGKTSASGRAIALNYLAHQYGGIVLTVKPDEKDLWLDYCQLTGRLNDLIIIEPEGRYFFNFMDFISSNEGQGGVIITENLVQILKTVIQASEEKSGGRGDDAFWETAGDLLLFNVVDLLKLAYGKVSIQDMYDVVVTSPKPEDNLSGDNSELEKTAFMKAFKLARDKVNAQVANWKKGFTKEAFDLMIKNGTFEARLLEALPDARLLKYVDQFFVETYRELSERTRSIIQFSFSGFLFRLLREPVYSLFCKSKSTVTPLDCMDGKIVLINLPIKKYHKVGRDCQIMFKYIAQRAFEKRDIAQNDRPVFIWQDESANFIHAADVDTQTTARSSRILTVCLTQNLPNFYANMGGDRAKYRVSSFMGTLGTKVFHANADIETNRYASDLFGQMDMEETSSSTTLGSNFSSTEGTTKRLKQIVRPEGFVSLRCGGPENNFKAEAFVHLQGKRFACGLSFDLVNFSQLYSLNNKNETS